MKLIEKVLRRPELEARPPVLVDIGASGQIYPGWQALAEVSVCIAFDADARDFAQRKHPYRALHVHPHVVSERSSGELDFYLTRSPHCSSTLEPDTEALSRYIFADLFDVEHKVKLAARPLSAVLAEHRLNYVDCLKIDSQGTDWRLFASLGGSVIARVLAVSFEPGIVDAYRGEDKLHTILAEMEKLPFWVHKMEVRGNQRLRRDLWEGKVRPRTRSWPLISLKTAPGWAEVSYFNRIEAESFDLRDHLLMWALATIEGQWGFALEVAERGQRRFNDPLLGELAETSLAQLMARPDRLLPEPAKKVVRALSHLGRRWFVSR